MRRLRKSFIGPWMLILSATVAQPGWSTGFISLGSGVQITPVAFILMRNIGSRQELQVLIAQYLNSFFCKNFEHI